MEYLMDTKEFEEFILDKENLVKVLPPNRNNVISALVKIPLSNGCVQIYLGSFYNEVFSKQRNYHLIGCLLPTGEIIRDAYYFDIVCNESEMQCFKVMREHEVKEIISKELGKYYQALVDEYCDKYENIETIAPEDVLNNFKRTNIVSHVFMHGADSAKLECSKMRSFNIEINNDIALFFSDKQEYYKKYFAETTMVDSSNLHDSAVERKASFDYIEKLVTDKDFESRKKMYEICENTKARLLTAVFSYPDCTPVSIKLPPMFLKSASIDTTMGLEHALNNKDYKLWRESLSPDMRYRSLTFNDLLCVKFKGKVLWEKDGGNE